MGVSYSTYAGHENGSRGIKRDSLRRYAKFFTVSPAWLEYGPGSDNMTNTKGEAPQEADLPQAKSVATRDDLITHVTAESEKSHSVSAVGSVAFCGVIQAGIWIDPRVFREEKALQTGVAAVTGEWERFPQFAYMARDNSAEELRIFDGDYVICVSYQRARGNQFKDKDIVVIERVRSDGTFERTVKRIKFVGASKFSLLSCSSDPRYPSIEIGVATMTEEGGVAVRLVGLAIGVCRPLPT